MVQHAYPPPPALAVDPLSAWHALGLSASELAALRRQGFVSAERAASGAIAYKLRFRCERRQRVVYLGRDADRAALIKVALDQWQQARSNERELHQLQRAATALLSQQRARLRPLLGGTGLYRHGWTVRQRRKTNIVCVDQPQANATPGQLVPVSSGDIT